MRTTFAFTFFSAMSMLCFAQSDREELPSNSFKREYSVKHPSLHYTYIDSSQTHDYSGNWDIDGDGKTDSVLFIGNGGAHLYFHLRLVLSGNNKVWDFPFLVSDMPAICDTTQLKDVKGKLGPLELFAIKDLDGDGVDDLFMNTGVEFADIPNKWKRRGVTSRYVVLHYENKQLVLTNYEDMNGRIIDGHVWKSRP